MGYIARKGRKPAEYASKAAHGHIIKDPSVEAFLHECHMPAAAEDVDITKHEVFEYSEVANNPIKHIIAIDGGYSEVFVKKDFPSSTITFFQFGALYFDVSDLEKITEAPFIDPEDIAKIKKIQRLKLTIPTKNVMLREEISLINSIRKTIFNFFKKESDDNKLIETLRWFIFEEYEHAQPGWNLASCPSCGKSNIELKHSDFIKDYVCKCPHCKENIYLTDVFRLHEAIDNEQGAGGILGYVVTLIEQIILVHIIKIMLRVKPSLLNEILFIKDGPLAFFGQTARMHEPMRNLVNYLFKNHNLYLSGLEKSGSFVEHADEIARLLKPNTVLLLDNNYIYKYIIPGKADASNAYGRTTYYGNKLIFKTGDGRIYVATLPTEKERLFPKKEDFRNLDIILTNLQKLKCDMYDSALIPVALVNRLVSLSNHPSSVILERFAKAGMK